MEGRIPFNQNPKLSLLAQVLPARYNLDLISPQNDFFLDITFVICLEIGPLIFMQKGLWCLLLFIDWFLSRSSKLRLAYHMKRVVALKLSFPDTGFVCKGSIKGMSKPVRERGGRTGEEGVDQASLQTQAEPHQGGLWSDATEDSEV